MVRFPQTESPGAQERWGGGFGPAGDPRGARERFSAALKLEPSNATALAGAGASAFALADYPRALRYLSLVPARTADVMAMQDLAELVLAHVAEPGVAVALERKVVARCDDQRAQQIGATDGAARDSEGR